MKTFNPVMPLAVSSKPVEEIITGRWNKYWMVKLAGKEALDEIKLVHRRAVVRCRVSHIGLRRIRAFDLDDPTISESHREILIEDVLRKKSTTQKPQRPSFVEQTNALYKKQTEEWRARKCQQQQS